EPLLTGTGAHVTTQFGTGGGERTRQCWRNMSAVTALPYAPGPRMVGVNPIVSTERGRSTHDSDGLGRRILALGHGSRALGVLVAGALASAVLLSAGGG